MRQFTDGNGQTWDITIDPTSIERVRSLTGFFIPDFLNDDKKALEKFGAEMKLKINVLYVLCLAQADELGINQDQFGESFPNWDIIADAQGALLEAFSDFCRKPVRLMLERGMKNAKIVEAKVEKQVQEMLDDPNLDNKIQKLMENELGMKSGDAPESLELTPENGHSET